MGWEDDLFALFDDLEQQADALYDAERAPEIADRSHSAYQQVTLAGRLMASVDREIVLDVLGVGAVAGTLERVGTGWYVVRGPAQDWVIRAQAVATVHGASTRALPEVAWSPVSKLGLGSALRRIAESGERCVLHQVDGARHDGELRRVGADFVEVVVAEDRLVLVAFESLSAVQSRD